MRVGISKVIAMRSKIVPGRFCYFFSIVVDLCNNSDQTLFSNAFGLGFQHLPRDLANVNAYRKLCLIPILYKRMLIELQISIQLQRIFQFQLFIHSRLTTFTAK